ncbi:Innexin, partial [Caligus rogercresseyi]
VNRRFTFGAPYITFGLASNMLHLFLGLKSLVKVNRYHTDGSSRLWLFWLHLHCHNTAIHWLPDHVCSYAGIPKDVLNTYCWIHPTYTLSSAHWKRVGIDVPHPGVDKTRDDRDKNMSNTISGSDF